MAKKIPTGYRKAGCCANCKFFQHLYDVTEEEEYGYCLFDGEPEPQEWRLCPLYLVSVRTDEWFKWFGEREVESTCVCDEYQPKEEEESG